MIDVMEPTIAILKNKTIKGKNHFINSDGKVLKSRRNARLSILGPIPLPLKMGKEIIIFKWYVFLDATQSTDFSVVHSALVLGNVKSSRSCVARIHSNCFTGDVLGSLRCDCGPQLQEGLKQIAAHKNGILLYMAGHEGRGIGLYSKAAAYLLQDSGYDTYEANHQLGFPDDLRDFEVAAIFLKFIRNALPVDLITNNPDKVTQLKSLGIRVNKIIHTKLNVNDFNYEYLRAKKQRGHLISDTLFSKKKQRNRA